LGGRRVARTPERFPRGHAPPIRGATTVGRRTGVVRTDVPPLLLALVTFALGAVPPVLARQAGASFPTGLIPQGPALGEMLMAIVLGGIGASASAQTAPRTRRALPAARLRRRRTRPAGVVP